MDDRNLGLEGIMRSISSSTPIIEIRNLRHDLPYIYSLFGARQEKVWSGKRGHLSNTVVTLVSCFLHTYIELLLDCNGISGPALHIHDPGTIVPPFPC